MRRLGLLLCLVLSARAGDEPLVRVYDLADLRAYDRWFALAMANVKAAAKGADVALHADTIVVNASAAVQEKVAEELDAIRRAFGILVTMEVRFVKAEGGLGVAALPVGRLDALLQERKAELTMGPTLTCYNGQQASLSAVRQVTYVSDFTFSSDEEGNVTADPVVETLPHGISAKLRPFASGGKVRVAAEVAVAEVGAEIPEIELPFPVPTPVRIQVPETRTRSVAKLVDCAPGEYAVLDLGGGQAVLIRAILAADAAAASK
jgi:hypothetical protein